MEKHTSKAYEQDLEKLREKILRMGGLCEDAIEMSMEALIERSAEIAKSTIERDQLINKLEMEIDEQCIELLALRQPAGSDLRLIITGLKISTDLERIGDLSVNICERVFELLQSPPLKPLIDLPRMARITTAMVHDSLDAYVRRDTALAEEVCARDDEVDELNEQIFRELLTYMMENPASITRALGLSMVARYLERIADHANSIAQLVIYLVKGEDIRHANTRDCQTAGTENR